MGYVTDALIIVWAAFLPSMIVIWWFLY